MIALISKTKDSFNHEGVVVRSGSMLCVMSPRIVVEEGFTRVPLHVMDSILAKQDLEWIAPRNSAQAHNDINTYRSEWLTSLQTLGAEEESSDFVLGSSRRPKSLRDAQSEREFRARRKRW